MRNVTIAYFVLVLLTATASWAEGNIDSGKALVLKWECHRCHGLTGNRRSTVYSGRPVPMLAGQPAQYLVRTLNEYRTGARVDDQPTSNMNLMVEPLTDQDVEDIAAYFEAQERY